MTQDTQFNPLSIVRYPALPEAQINNWFDYALNSSCKGYSHFDSRFISLKSPSAQIYDFQQDCFPTITMYQWVMIPSNIVSHSFLPFIHYTQCFNKVSYIPDGACVNEQKEENKRGKLKCKPKTRKIFYASHFDRCIYQYYSFQLNYFYTSWMCAHDINDVSIAYRPNSGKSNIEYAKIAFDKIEEFGKCFIVVSDFTSFFDNIDCDYLKNCMCEVLGVDRLSDDWFAVFKSVSNHSWVNMDDIVTLLKEKDQREKSIKIETNQQKKSSESANDSHKPKSYSNYAINSEDRVPNIIEFKILLQQHNQSLDGKNQQISILNRYRAKDKAPNGEPLYKPGIGIPQGSPISAVMANVYMIHFDEMLHDLAKQLGGLYMRYSDDMIFIVRVDDESECFSVYESLHDCFSSFKHQVGVNRDKTKTLFFDKNKIYSFDVDNNSVNFDKKQNLSYLGFVFKGEEVLLRQGSISKYHYRMRKKCRSFVDQIKRGEPRIPHELYRIYANSSRNTRKSSIGKRGNFISYLYRVQRVFALRDPNVIPLVRRSKQKIAKAIKYFNKMR